jgi:hypothetical protein
MSRFLRTSIYGEYHWYIFSFRHLSCRLALRLLALGINPVALRAAKAFVMLRVHLSAFETGLFPVSLFIELGLALGWHTAKHGASHPSDKP